VNSSERSTPGWPATPAAALAQLCAGNARFVGGTGVHPHQDAEHRAALAHTQRPYAVILACSDSRLAVEIIFDQGLGDLFVIRNAGHTIGPEVLGSVEYAVTVLRTPLIAVLGHASCGAVQAALETARSGTSPGGYVAAVVAGVAPSVELARSRSIDDVDGIVDVHIEHTVAELLQRSAAIAEAVRAGECNVVGMCYSLGDGQVTVVKGLAQAAQPSGQTPRSR
jgi:carbonic anhydrase